MKRLFGLTLAAAMLCATSVFAESPLPDGSYRLSQSMGQGMEYPLCLIKVETKDGKTIGTLEKAAERVPIKKADLKLDGKKIVLTTDLGGSPVYFEGTIIDPKAIKGSLGDDKRTSRALLAKQDEVTESTLTPPPPTARSKAPEVYTKAMRALSEPNILRAQAARSKDANEKAELLAKAKLAAEESDAKAIPLLKEVIEKHAKDPFAVDAAQNLLRMAAKTKATPEETAAWVKFIEEDAKLYGDKIHRDTILSTAESLSNQKGLETLALELARKGADKIGEKDTLTTQSRTYKTLAKTLKNANKVDEAKAIDDRIAKLEVGLDEEYKLTVPPFKPEPYGGRSGKANRVAVFELFTGAQCPPCVAADVAFDALDKAYKPTDLVLIQYHMHIPGPDPLTNLDTIARWDYYRGLAPMEVRGTPTSIFNGKIQAGGGGGMGNSKGKFHEYKVIIDEILEKSSDLSFKGSAKLTGDEIAIDVAVDGVKDEKDLKLRFILVEESLKYVGGNGLRFHHQVVRALPGGAKGMDLTASSNKQSVKVNLGELRTNLVKYLDEYAKERPFSNPDRPLDLKHLKLIAIVQNDTTGEILNAASFDVK
jgi:hypothetical protein